MAICLVQGPALLAIGLVGILGGWLYTGGPRPYKYDGLGDPAIIWLMGPLLTQGAYTAVTGDAFHAPAFWLGLAPGLLIAAVLAANNASDIEDDRARRRPDARRADRLPARAGAVPRRAGVRLPRAAGALGRRPVRAGHPPAARAPRRSPSPARARRSAARAPATEQLLTLAPQVAQLHLLFSVLLCAGVLLDRV